ncbi:MAG TPA: 30S ribosomal protein S12 methylthiotransferase RimO [Acidobacteriota bacterium]|nr:30S ribosomal protein S12 methylthiotransferase RimO [Acidobacteriota bacterium]
MLPMRETGKESSKQYRLKVGLCSLGCAKNQVDSEVMLGKLRDAGFSIVDDPSFADAIVVNTCAFIDDAKQESIDTILEMAQYKDGGNCRRLVVAGCLSQRYRAEIVKAIPEIDACLGIDELDKIADACRGSFQPVAETPPLPLRLDCATQERVLISPSHYAYLKISDGCDHRCSFCVIPKIRGKYRSRQPQDVVAEAEKLIGKGVKELILVAQDLGRYGRDIGMEDGLVSLVEQLVRLDGLSWLRLLYVYPEGISPRLIELIASEERLVPYLDIPLQHASARVLKSMSRGGSGEKALQKISALREAVPEIAIRTSLIVGFPTEEERDFEELLDFVAAARFDHLGAFAYSHEEGSDAHEHFEDRWPPEIKGERRNRVMALQSKISLEKNHARIGSRSPCIIDGLHPDSEMLLAGRLPTQSPDADGIVIINEGSARPGEIVSVEITEAHPYDLVGRIVDD